MHFIRNTLQTEPPNSNFYLVFLYPSAKSDTNPLQTCVVPYFSDWQVQISLHEDQFTVSLPLYLSSRQIELYSGYERSSHPKEDGAKSQINLTLYSS